MKNMELQPLQLDQNGQEPVTNLIAIIMSAYLSLYYFMQKLSRPSLQSSPWLI